MNVIPIMIQTLLNISFYNISRMFALYMSVVIWAVTSEYELLKCQENVTFLLLQKLYYSAASMASSQQTC